ncbi:MAG: zinc dependent phospholipase C family protein [Nitrososphaerota archaeon]
MPKTAVHVMVLDEVINRLRSSSDPLERKIGNIMYNNRSAAVLGAIGPDLFFWAPDYEVVDKLYNFYKNWKWIIDLYNETIGKVKEALEALGEPVEEAVETLAPTTVALIKSLIEEIRETSNLLKSTTAMGLFKGVIEGYDIVANMADSPGILHTLFDWFTPPLQAGKREADWYWFDMLHYRNTGRFAANLIALADDDVKLAYAYGYLTHIATDVVGHGFVNQIVGGPYRLHPQRHATCENFIDSWKFYQLYDRSINEELHGLLQLPDSLPSGVTKLLHDSFINTYKNLPHPGKINRDYEGFYKPENIAATYEVFRFVMEVLGGMRVEPPEEPFSGVLDVLSDALRNLEPPPSPPRGRETCSLEDIFSFGLTEGSRECYEEFFESVEEWLQYLAELLEWTFETILALLDFLISALLSLPIMALMAILYAVQIALYNFYRQLRQVLVLGGLLYPEPDELGNAIARNLTTPYQCSSIVEFKGYPRLHSHRLNNLQCPNTNIEEPRTLPAMHEREPATTPDTFITSEPFSEENLVSYASARTPQETRELEGRRLAIGNAVSFSYWMITNAMKQSSQAIVFTDWNLDSDRGYGYKCWYWEEREKTDTYISLQFASKEKG